MLDNPEESLAIFKQQWSHVHALSAVHLARKARDLEQVHDPSDDLKEEHRSFVLGSLFFSVAFLEATINEVFSDAHESALPMSMAQVANVLRSLLSIEKLRRNLDCLGALEKYDMVLFLAGKEPFERSRDPYQSAADVIKLRNFWIHYKQEWIQLEPPGGHPLEKRLHGKFDVNPWQKDMPHLYVSYDCAAWAFCSAALYVKEFVSKLPDSPISWLGKQPLILDLWMNQIRRA